MLVSGGVPAPLCYEDGKQVVLVIATDAMQLEEGWWGGVGGSLKSLFC